MPQKYMRKPVTMDGVRRDFGDHVFIRGEVDIHLPGDLHMTALIKDTLDDSLQQYLLAVKALVKKRLMKIGWNGVGDVRICDLGPDPSKEVAFHRATYFAQDTLVKKIFVSLPKDRADAALDRLGISKVVGEA